MNRKSVTAGCALLVVAACSRTPEPTASSSVSIPPATAPSPSAVPMPVPVPALVSSSTASASASASATANANANANRCIRETPATPPPVAPPLPPGRCPKDPTGNLALSKVTVSFLDTPHVKMEAELARAPNESERGLMYRTKMDEDKGMLFDLLQRREHTFWMHNTCMPLDMLFIDDDGTIVGILENVPTLNDDERSVGCPSSWVLEVVAGWSRRHGVRAGQRIALPKR